MKQTIQTIRAASRKLAAALLIAGLCLTNIASGQESLISGSPAEVSVEQLESAIRTVEARSELHDEIRTKVVEQLKAAEALVTRRLAAEAGAAAYAEALENAPAKTADLRATLEQDESATLTSASLGIGASSILADLEPWLAREQADLVAATARLAELDAEIAAQTVRPVEARQRISTLRSSMEEVAGVISMPPSADEPKILAEARKLSARLRRVAQGAEIEMLSQELSSHSTRLNLLRARRDVAARSRSESSRRVELLQAAVNERRQVAAVLAQQSAAAAELAAADKHPVVRALAEGNASLTFELPEAAAKIEQITGRLDGIDSQVRDIEQRLARSEQRLEVGGLSQVIGRLLIEERRNLPKVSKYRAEVRARSKTLAEVGLAQVRIQEQRRELAPLDARIDEVMAEAGEITDEQQLSEIRAEVRLLLRDRRDLLEQADKTYSSYLQALGDLDVAQRRLLDSVDRYKEFLDKNLLWIPSAPVAFTGAWQDVAPAAAWALSPQSWLATLTALADSLREHPLTAAFCALLLALLVIVRRPLAHRYKTMSGLVGRLSTDHIGLTLAALAIAALRALPLPLLLAVVAWFLNNTAQDQPFSTAVAGGLIVVAPFLYNVLLFRVLSTRDGVLRVHFGWQEHNLAIIRRQLDRLAAIGSPLVFATVFLFQSEVAEDRATLGRLAFIALLLVLALVIRPLLHPDSGIATSYYARNADRWVSKLRWFWYALAAGGPLLLGVVSGLGYLYTSLILTGLLVNTFWLALGLIVVDLVVLRWLALARRKLAWHRALKEREAQKAEKSKELQADKAAEVPIVTSQPLDLDAVDLQTRKLLRSGLFLIAVLAVWGIWADVLPAFSLLDKVALWSKTVMVDGVEAIAPVTLADLLLALVVAGVTAVAAKNLPGLMEIAILQRLTLQPGSRYTITTMVQYVAATVGTISVLNIVGWNWSQIQWLVAALSVGLGFGLQEIVANFVSGLIILFERPIRVGDTVTVGELTGTVSRVRIRATTITDWDRKEIIVPNKSFITEQVVNWTLSDPITRIVIPVGISYGSDVDRAHKIMEDTLRSLPLVLDEPPPKVYFIGFGESSLDFNLYAYSRQLADRLPLTHAVHESILSALREHDIEIPFPQRDLHVRSTVESKGGQAESRD